MAAGPTFEPIATASLNGGTSYTFSSIPSTYTDLVLVGSCKMDGGTTLRIRFNGSTSGYPYKFYLSDGGVSKGATSQVDLVDNDGVIFSNFYADIQDYSGSTLATKSLLCRSGDQTYGWMVGGGWNDSNIINSITIFTTNGRIYSAGSRLTLYGIARA
jgi:hypothetical protein